VVLVMVVVVVIIGSIETLSEPCFHGFKWHSLITIEWELILWGIDQFTFPEIHLIWFDFIRFHSISFDFISFPFISCDLSRFQSLFYID
jgi:hypothetical protein